MKRLAMIMVVAAFVTFNTVAQGTVNIEWVTIGDPGNAADTEVMNDGTTAYGAVDYYYMIGKYEVTNSQYCQFLNAVAASDLHGLYNPNMASGWNDIGGIVRTGSSGSYTYSVRPGRENKPVNYVSFYDCLRFCNWLHNGQPTGEQNVSTTEDGAYDMSLGDATTRKPRARVWLSDENEWYKAAYYRGGNQSAGYWNYATKTYISPTPEAPSGTDMVNGSVNYGNAVGSTINVGAYNAKPSDSAYGTFDQSGNLREWNETLVGSNRGVRGGAFNSDDTLLKSNYRNSKNALDEDYATGFRVAGSGQIIYVDADALGNSDGSSWENAYNYLREALAAASIITPPVEIWVAEGTYKPDEDSANPEGTGDLMAAFQLTGSLAVYGGFAGVGELNPDVRDVQLHETILSGDLDGDDVKVSSPADLRYEPSRVENSYHVVSIVGTHRTAVLSGFTVTSGHNDHLRGGGIAGTGQAKISHCRVIGNYAHRGGGIYGCSGGIMYCTVSGNGARGYGGGISSSSPVTHCTISGNSAAWGGGVVWVRTINNCIFTENSPGAVLSWGYSSAPTVTNCVFKQNVRAIASYSGGLIKAFNCIFNGNSSALDLQRETSVIVKNCTFMLNSRALRRYNMYAGSVELTNSIIWGDGEQIDDVATTVIEYCDVPGGWPGAGNIDEDPLFVDAGAGDYRLLAGSSCINSGSNAGLPPDTADLDGDGDTTEPIPYDFAGNPRIVGTAVDMGAYEGAYVNNPPTACITGGDRTAITETGCEATVTLDGSCSNDPDSTPGTNNDIVSFDWYDEGVLLGSGEILECNLSLGEHPIVLEVTDSAGEVSTCSATITVKDSNPPEITLNGPQELFLECGVDSYTEPGATATDLCDGDVPVVISGDIVNTSTCGTYIVTYDATDSCENTAEQVIRTVIVQDTTPPEFTLSVTPDTLWPPNNKMVEITVSWTVSDICDPAPEVSLQSIMILEGDDIQVDDDGSIHLRAKSGGRPTGRIYLITYQSIDHAGNITVRSATVTVPAPQDK